MLQRRPTRFFAVPDIAEGVLSGGALPSPGGGGSVRAEQSESAHRGGVASNLAAELLATPPRRTSRFASRSPTLPLQGRVKRIAASLSTNLPIQFSNSGHTSAFSRRNSSESYKNVFPRIKRGSRECRTLGASAAACVVVVNTRVSHHGHAGNVRHSPHNGFNGLYRALPGDRALLSPSPV
jgi:hypothetical protein